MVIAFIGSVMLALKDGFVWGDSILGDMLALFAGLIQGLALMATVMNKFKVNGFWRWLFYILILINGLFAQILAFTGLFDMVFDYRRRFSRRNGD
jgi:hypothetical protein